MKKNNLYYLVEDILNCFSATTDPSLISALSRHLISKEAVKSVLKEEIQSKKPRFSVIRGSLMVQNNFLRQFSQNAFYEVIDILDELKYCLEKDKRKTIKRLSSQVILRLFTTLYFEFRMLPMHHKEDEEYIDKFKKYFSKEQILEIMKTE